jgi:hypothetical protein
MAVKIVAWAQISHLGVGPAPFSKEAGPIMSALADSYPHAGLDQQSDSIPLRDVAASEIRQMDLLTRTTLSCAQRAMKAAGLDETRLDAERAGLILGSAFGCAASNEAFLQPLVRRGPRFVQPVVFRNTVSNAVAGHLSIALGLRGSNSVLNSGMLAGIQALAYAFEEISAGHCQILLAGACDGSSSVMVQRYLARASSEGPPVLPLIDGACLLILASRADTENGAWYLRGYGLGYAASGRWGETLMATAKGALDRAGITFDQVDMIVLQGHATAWWARASRPMRADLRQRIETMLSSGRLVYAAENTALPAMLALVDCLVNLPRLRSPSLFFREGFQDRGDPLPGIPRFLLYGSMGADGSVASWVLQYEGNEHGQPNHQGA